MKISKRTIQFGLIIPYILCSTLLIFNWFYVSGSLLFDIAEFFYFFLMMIISLFGFRYLNSSEFHQEKAETEIIFDNQTSGSIEIRKGKEVLLKFRIVKSVDG